MSIDKVLVDILKSDSNAYIGKVHDTGTTVLVANWNKISPTFEKILSQFYPDVVTGFEDEYSSCGNCGELIETTTRPKNHWTDVENCEEICGTCVEKDPSDYIEFLTDSPENANTILSDTTILNAGFVLVQGDFETGLHPHQTDDPSTIATKYKKENPDTEILFHIDGTSQFDISFSLYSRTV